MTSSAAKSYPELLSKTRPEVVHDEALNEHFIALLRELDERWENLSTDEKKLHELLVLIIQDFEKRTYKIPAATPIEIIEELMAANNLSTKDLVGIFADENSVSEVLNGKQCLSVEHIKGLSERFNVSPAVFFA